MIMENLTDRYEIIDGTRLVFNPKVSAYEVHQIFETWKGNESATDISVIDMSNCNIAELRQPDDWSNSRNSLISESFKNLVEFIAPRVLEKIGDSYFRSCEKLKNVKFDFSSNSITEIGENAFLYCDSLVQISLPNSLKKIGNGAFKGCDSLEFMELSANIEEIGEDSFANSKNLILIDLSRCLKIKELRIKVSAKHVYLPAHLEILECSGMMENLWLPPTIKEIAFKSLLRTNIWCFSDRLVSLNHIENYGYLCVPHSLTSRYQKMAEIQQQSIKIFDFGEDGHRAQDYFWI